MTASTWMMSRPRPKRWECTDMHKYDLFLDEHQSLLHSLFLSQLYIVVGFWRTFQSTSQVAGRVAILLVLLSLTASIDIALYAVELQVRSCAGQIDSQDGSERGKDGGRDC